MAKRELKTAFIEKFRIEKSVKDILVKRAKTDDRTLTEYLRVQLKKIVS